MKEKLDKKCGCGKNLIVCGSPSSGFYTQCDCGRIGYFDDDKGRKLYYQRETNNDDENSFLTDTE